MANLEAPGRGADTRCGTYVLNAGTRVAAAVAVCQAQRDGGGRPVCIPPSPSSALWREAPASAPRPRAVLQEVAV
jgi:hypothetical protein